MAGRAWKEYLQLDTDALTDAELRVLTGEALEATALMAPKVKKAAAPKKAK